MEYIHIRSLEKFHPGYKDRELKWAKIHFGMVQGDPDCELIDNEIDWGRLVKMILLELEAKKPLPNIDRYWEKKGFDIKIRPMSLTIQMLHNFIEVVTQLSKECVLDKSKKKIKNRVDKEEDRDAFLYLTDPIFLSIFESYLKTRKKKATDHAKELILKDLHKVDKDTAIAMLEQSIKNGWTGIFPLKKENYNGQRTTGDNRQGNREDKYAGIGKKI